jgi:hypothetical protein
MVVLAALPGMVKQLLVTGKIVDPGNFGATVNFLGFQLRKAGLAKRDKLNLDIFWLKDDSLEDSANLEDPDVIAAEIVEDLRAALEEFELILGDLNS